MGRYGITYEDVASVASQLTAQGRQPTIELIRQLLGTGSSTTISNYFRQWRADQKHGVITPDVERVPKEMVGMLQDFWGRLSSQAEQKISEVEAKTQQEIMELKEALEKYKTNNTRWQKLFSEWQQEKEQLLADNLLLKQTIDTQREEIAVLNAKLGAQAFQANEKKLHIEDLHRMQQQVQANLEHYRESTREQRLLEQAQFERQKQELQQEIKVIREELCVSKDRINSAELDYKILQQSNQSLQSSHQECSVDYKKQAEQLITLRAEKQEQQERSQHWERECHLSQQALNDKTQQLVELRDENKLLLKRFMDTQAAFNAQLDKMTQLFQENDQLLMKRSS